MAAWQFWLLLTALFWSTALQLRPDYYNKAALLHNVMQNASGEHTRFAITVTMLGLYLSGIMIFMG